jgi:hypothetical protein
MPPPNCAPPCHCPNCHTHRVKLRMQGKSIDAFSSSGSLGGSLSAPAGSGLSLTGECVTLLTMTPTWSYFGSMSHGCCMPAAVGNHTAA